MGPRRGTFAPFFTFGIILTCLAGGQLLLQTFERDDIWWTPMNHAPSLGESGDRLKIYVRGAPLEEKLAAGEIRMIAGSESSPLEADDFRIRLNNRDHVLAARLPIVAAQGAGLATGIFLIILGFLARRRLQNASGSE